MKKKSTLVLLGLTLLLALASTALAKDAVVATIPAGGAPGAIGIDQNGNPLSPGTYAIGTLKLHYSNVATSWVPGEFTDFTLNIKLQQGKLKPPTGYPVNVYFRQSGRGLQLEVTDCVGLGSSFANSVLTLSSVSAEANCTVKVSIPPVDATLNFDGALLVGNLQMETDAGAHLDTVTSVQVRVMLVFPSAACLKLYNVITDNGVGQTVDPFVITANYNKNNQADGSIKNTSPTNPADVVYVVNTCPDPYTVDIKIVLEGHFLPNIPNNMGVFTSTTFDANTDTIPGDFAEFTVGPANSETGASACLTSKTILGNNTLLARDKMVFDSSIVNVSSLPNYPGSHGTDWTGQFSSFTSGVFVDGTGCTSASPDADPPSITLPLSFSVEY